MRIDRTTALWVGGTARDQTQDPDGSFNWSSVAAGDEHYGLALEAYNTGHTFPEMIALLEGCGLSPELIPDVTTAVAANRASFMFSAGKSGAAVAQVLTGRGLSAEDAAYVAGSVDRARDRVLASVGMGKWHTRALVAGGLLLMAGLVLHTLGQLGGPVMPGELIAGLLGSGVLLAGVGGVSIAIGMA